MNFLHTYLPAPLLFKWGPISISWYGLLLALALIAGFIVTHRLAQQAKIKLDITNLFLMTFVWGFIGARLYHVLNELPYYRANLLEIIAVWHGGLAIHGALIAGATYLGWVSWKHKQSPWKLADLLIPGLVIGQAIGRWGNYFNQELYGKPTNLPWSIPIDSLHRVSGYQQFSYFHPTFLYESLWDILIFAIVWLVWRRKKTASPDGVVLFLYLTLYGLGRGLAECVRIDDTPLIAGIRLPIIMSGVLLTIGLAGLGALRRGKKLPWRAGRAS